jgi:hypothetical protein
MVLNTLLRFWWVFGIFHYYFDNDKTSLAHALDILGFGGMLAEALRRTFWAVLRVENEFYNNFESYRSIPTIPSLFD